MDALGVVGMPGRCWYAKPGSPPADPAGPGELRLPWLVRLGAIMDGRAAAVLRRGLASFVDVAEDASASASPSPSARISSISSSSPSLCPCVGWTAIRAAHSLQGHASV